MAKTIVAIGCSTWWDYALLAPLAALLWRDVVGFHLRLLLIGDEPEWNADPCAKASLAALRAHAIDHVFVRRVEGYEVSTLAQNVRQHAAAAPNIDDETWVMMSDADLWPLCRDFYHQHDERIEKAVLYYGAPLDKNYMLTGYDSGDLFNAFPTCHVTMRAREWRTLYEYPGNVDASLKHTLDSHLAPRIAGKTRSDAATTAWNFDQFRATERICRQDWFPAKACALGIMSRAHIAPWGAGGQWETDWRSCTDAHIRHGIYAERRWAVLLPVIDALLPQHSTWVREYFETTHEAWKKAERIP